MLAAAFAAKDRDALAAHVGERGQREKAFAVERRVRNAHVGQPTAPQRARRCRAGGVCRERSRASVPGGHTVFRGIARDEDRGVVGGRARHAREPATRCRPAAG